MKAALMYHHSSLRIDPPSLLLQGEIKELGQDGKMADQKKGARKLQIRDLKIFKEPLGINMNML